MAIALVGSLGAVTTVTSNPTPAFGQATTAGNLLIAWVNPASGISPSFSGSGWTRAATGGGATDLAQIWYKANCGAGETAPTISGGLINACRLGEFSGADKSSPLENQSGASATSATSPVADACGSADAATGNLVIGCFSDLQSKAGTDTTAMTFTGGAAVTAGNVSNDATSTTAHYRFAYGLTTTNAAADTVSCTSASMNISLLITCIASFKQSGTRVPRSPGVDSGFGHF